MTAPKTTFFLKCIVNSEICNFSVTWMHQFTDFVFPTMSKLFGLDLLTGVMYLMRKLI